jgi:hypothetical protein
MRQLALLAAFAWSIPATARARFAVARRWRAGLRHAVPAAGLPEGHAAADGVLGLSARVLGSDHGGPGRRRAQRVTRLIDWFDRYVKNAPPRAKVADDHPARGK